MKAAIVVACTTFLLLVVYTQFTIFIIPPIGAVPEGRTLILFRFSLTLSGEAVSTKSEFLDSADAICLRRLGYINLFCRAMVLSAIAQSSVMLLRLPYSSTLHALIK